MTGTILVVEDHETLALGLSRSLEAAGFQAMVAGGRSAAEEAMAAEDPALVILDLMLPDGDGLDVLRDLRAAGSDVPVLVLTARGEEIDKLMGFRLGADDYVVKPVGVLELLARVEALLRRARAGEPGEEVLRAVQFGKVVVDAEARTVHRDGEAVSLSPREFDLLLCLIEHQGRAVSRETILTKAWNYNRAVATRSVDTHVFTLRAKLEDDPSRPEHIVTVPKVGYRLVR